MSSRQTVFQFKVFFNRSIFHSMINCRPINNFLHFILVFDNVISFFFLPRNATQVFGWKMLILSLSYNKLNSYNYYVNTTFTGLVTVKVKLEA